MRASAICALLALVAVGHESHPLPRSGHALVYDSQRRMTLLVNGDHNLGQTEGEVWAWTTPPSVRRRAARPNETAPSSPWRLIDTSGPPPRTLSAVTFDSRRGVLVIQGGIGPGDTLYGDTQEWDGHQWRTVAEPGDGPGFRNHDEMVYDEARGVIVLFGGQDRNVTVLNDTWEFDGETWRRVATSGPPPRVHFALVYDALRQRVLLYGGSNIQGDLSDFWEWDGQTWRAINAHDPGPRSAHRMAFHRGRGEVFLVGGYGADNQVWTWNGSVWSRFAGPSPPSRGYHAMDYDDAKGILIVFGGYSGGIERLGDTWMLSGDHWLRIDG